MPLHGHTALDIAVTTTILLVALSKAPLSAVAGNIETRSNLFLAAVLDISRSSLGGMLGYQRGMTFTTLTHEDFI